VAGRQAGTSDSSNQHEITSTNVVEIDFTNAVNAVTNVMFHEWRRAVDGFGSNLEFSGFVPSLQNGNDENFHSLPNMSYYIFQALLHLPSNGMRCGLQHHQPQRFAK